MNTPAEIGIVPEQCRNRPHLKAWLQTQTSPPGKDSERQGARSSFEEIVRELIALSPKKPISSMPARIREHPRLVQARLENSIPLSFYE